MGTEHTPGPWEAIGGTVMGLSFDFPGQREVLARTYPNRKKLPEYVAANTRLMAAAPKLLDALILGSRLVSTFLVEHGGKEGMTPETFAMRNGTLEKMREAIAMATGGTPDA